MALAPFFGKAALGLTQILRGTDYDGLRRKLEAAPIGLRVSSAAAKTPSGKAAAELSANLLARLYPKVSLSCPDALGGDLWTLMRRINPDIEEATGSTVADLLVGDVESDSQSSVGISACRWQVYLTDGRGAPDFWDQDPNILGGAFAACIGVASVFRRVFSDLGMDPTVSTRSLSLLDYGPPSLENPGWEEPVLPSTYLAGVGAIGNASVWAFQRLPLRGQLHLVDGEQVVLSNLQRYVLADTEHVGWPKVVVAERGFISSRLGVTSHPCTLEDVVAQLKDDAEINHLLVAVDSAETRVAAQTILPRSIWNAWTDDDAVGVSIHRRFGSDQPCLACMYADRSPRESELALLCRSVGLSAQEIVNLLTLNAGLTAEHISKIEQYHHLREGSLGAWIGSSVLKFREEVICGGILTRLAGWSDRSEETLVPLAHQSALAGIVLAAEYLKDLSGLSDENGPTVFQCPISKPLPEVLTFRQRRGKEVQCFCTDPDYVARWVEKWEK